MMSADQQRVDDADEFETATRTLHAAEQEIDRLTQERDEIVAAFSAKQSAIETLVAGGGTPLPLLGELEELDRHLRRIEAALVNVLIAATQHLER